MVSLPVKATQLLDAQLPAARQPAASVLAHALDCPLHTSCRGHDHRKQAVLVTGACCLQSAKPCPGSQPGLHIPCPFERSPATTHVARSRKHQPLTATAEGALLQNAQQAKLQLLSWHRCLGLHGTCLQGPNALEGVKAGEGRPVAARRSRVLLVSFHMYHNGTAHACRGRKRWILSVPVRGALLLDAGAVRAIRDRAKSLFSAGIVKVVGNFAAQDAVSLCDEDGAEFGRGLCNYRHDEVARVQVGTVDMGKVDCPVMYSHSMH